MNVTIQRFHSKSPIVNLRDRKSTRRSARFSCTVTGNHITESRIPTSPERLLSCHLTLHLFGASTLQLT